MTSKDSKAGQETNVGPDEETRTPIKNLLVASGLALIILAVVFFAMKFFG